ncbi:unnamed protein product [Linum tenue]|uniref:F-box domain-containing protein n=1 Tax=Linum tenue TaxID=586396 RepID=A0AAV0JK66_9ROSI|nr:unnamed protein product [Linum tenue]
MATSDDENDSLAQFLESEVLSELSDQEEAEGPKELHGNDEVEAETQPKAKRIRVDEGEDNIRKEKGKERADEENGDRRRIIRSRRIESGIFSVVPPELFPHILKFLSSEDLVSCSRVCRFMNLAASDESLWRRLYCMRWGILPPTKNLSQRAWKKLYIQRDEEDIVNLLSNCPPEFKRYYVQMQAAKRSQTPNPSQCGTGVASIHATSLEVAGTSSSWVLKVMAIYLLKVKDDRIILDKTVADQISIWKTTRGLTDDVAMDHRCSGNTCSYYQIGDVFVCEKTGNVHVCDETCREVITDPSNELLVCTISGRCSDMLLLPSEMEPEPDQQQFGGMDEAEPFMGSGRFARAYMLGYNCENEEELEATLRFC